MPNFVVSALRAIIDIQVIRVLFQQFVGINNLPNGHSNSIIGSNAAWRVLVQTCSGAKCPCVYCDLLSLMLKLTTIWPIKKESVYWNQLNQLRHS